MGLSLSIVYVLSMLYMSTAQTGTCCSGEMRAKLHGHVGVTTIMIMVEEEVHKRVAGVTVRSRADDTINSISIGVQAKVRWPSCAASFRLRLVGIVCRDAGSHDAHGLL